MPADEPDTTTGAAGPAGERTGRRRHARPDAAGPAPTTDPRLDPRALARRGSSRRRHARPDADAPPAEPGAGPADPYRGRYREASAGPTGPATWGSTPPPATRPRAGHRTAPADDPYRDPYGNDPQGDPQGSDPYGSDPYGSTTFHDAPYGDPGPDAPGSVESSTRRDTRLPPARATLQPRRAGPHADPPAELFVETTAETTALPLDDGVAAELADADATPGRRAGRDGWTSLLRTVRTRLGMGAADPTRAAIEPGQGHGHGHGHGPALPADRRVRILLATLLGPCALATLVGLVLLWPTGGPPATAHPITQDPVKAQVSATRATDCAPESGDGGCVALVVHMTDGPRAGRDLVQVVPVEPGTPVFAVGDQVVLAWSGANPDDAGSYQVIDFQRTPPLWWLAGLFAVAVLLLGRWKGLAALAALGLSFVVLLMFVVPAILAGHNPLAVAVVGSCLIMFAVLYLTHGPSARTSTAVLGTLLSLALIGVLSAGFSAAARLTGLDDQTRNLITSLGAGVDARGLLLAGVVIGALGVLDDVTVTQTSAVWELHAANPSLGPRGLFTAAMRIGRDHVASAVNTLVLAYAGAALPLMMLFSLSGSGIGNIVTSQEVATEIVRTLVGSIGLVASVPITTALAAAVASRERPAAG